MAPHDPDDPLDSLGEPSNDCAAPRAHIGAGRPAEGRVEHKPQDGWFDKFGEGSETPIIRDPADGLPRPADDAIHTNHILPLNEDTLVCLADTRSFVELFLEEISLSERLPYTSLTGKAKGREKALVLFPKGYDPRSQYAKDGALRLRRMFTAEQVRERWGVLIAYEDQKPVCFVRPVRPVCKHLARQIAPSSEIDAGDRMASVLYTYCKALKSVGGAFLDLGSESVTACELREPRDPRTEVQIEAFVRTKIKQGKERRHLPMFAEAAAPAAPEALPDWGGVTATIYHPAKDPLYGSGGSNLHVRPPSELGEREVIEQYDETDVVIVGTAWAPTQHKLRQMGLPHSANYHHLLLRPEYIVAEPTAEYLRDWPMQVDPFLPMSLERMPKYIAERLERGKRVLVTGASKELCDFFVQLVFRRLRFSSLETFADLDGGELPAVTTPELVAYLARTAKKEIP